MKTVTINLGSIDKVKSFVNDITKFDSEFDLVSGRYVIDAKSIMGIFSLDLSKPINLNIHGDEDNAENALLGSPCSAHHAQSGRGNAKCHQAYKWKSVCQFEG